MNANKRRLYPCNVKLAASGAGVVADTVKAVGNAAKKAPVPAAPKSPGMLSRVMAAITNKPIPQPANPASKMRDAIHQARLRDPNIDFDNMGSEELLQTIGMTPNELAALGPNAEQTLVGIRRQADEDYGRSVSRFTADRDTAVQSAVTRREAELGEQMAAEQDQYRAALMKETDPARVRMLQRGMLAAGVAAPVLGVGGAVAGSKLTEERAKKDLTRQRLLAFGAGAAAGAVMPGTVGHIGRTMTQAAQIPQQFQRDYSRFGGGPAAYGGYQKTSSTNEDADVARLRALMQQFVENN